MAAHGAYQPLPTSEEQEQRQTMRQRQKRVATQLQASRGVQLFLLYLQKQQVCPKARTSNAAGDGASRGEATSERFPGISTDPQAARPGASKIARATACRRGLGELQSFTNTSRLRLWPTQTS
jgi:hypothetical protein